MRWAAAATAGVLPAWTGVRCESGVALEEALEKELSESGSLDEHATQREFEDAGFELYIHEPLGGDDDDVLGSTVYELRKALETGEELSIEFALADDEEAAAGGDGEHVDVIGAAMTAAEGGAPQGEVLSQMMGEDPGEDLVSNFKVQLSKPNGGVLVAECVVEKGDYAVEKLKVGQQGDRKLRVHEFSQEEMSVSVGHEADIEDGVLDYLEARGVDEALVGRINAFLEEQVHRDYMAWLRDMRAYLG